ncbi:MAG: hypothetical protein M3Y19_02855 [Actinomycetota bacterium]|nr:hypothetical protein [Actinomycetota bacterium]
MGKNWHDLGDNYGLITRPSALAVVSAHTVGNATQRGRLCGLQHGVYVSAKQSIGPEVRAAAALQVLYPVPGVVSHHTAARLHRIPAPETAREHVVVARAHRRKNHARLYVHTGDVDTADQVMVDGIMATAPARTVIDLCRTVQRVDGAWAVDRALNLHLVSAETLQQAMMRLQRAPGMRQARALCETADAGSQSPLETRGRLALLDGGLPRPESQIRLQGVEGVVYLDLGYREAKLGIEFDGRAVHERPEALLADRWRQNSVLGLGWRLLRFTWFDVVRRPNWMVDCVRRALG